MADEAKKVDYTVDEATKAVEYVRKAKARALKARVEWKLMIAKAKAAGITVTDKEVNDYITAHKLS